MIKQIACLRAVCPSDIKCWEAEKCLHPMSDDALGYATRLAQTLWEAHWKSDAPDWKVLPDLLGVLTQIDNMASGMTRRPLPLQDGTLIAEERTDG